MTESVTKTNVDAKKARETLDGLVGLIEIYVSFLRQLGQLERDHGDTLGILKRIGERSPEFVEEFVKSAPIDVVGKFMKLILRMASLSSKLQGKDINTLSADEKLKLADEFDVLLSEMKQLLKMWKG